MFANTVKARHHFKVHFDDFGNEDAEYLMAHVRRVRRPGFRTFDLMGLTDSEFTQIELDLLDEVNDRVRGAVMHQLYRQNTQEAEFSLVIETADRNGRVVEQWVLTGCRIAQVDFDEMSNDSSEELRIHLLIAPRRLSTTAGGAMLDLVR